MNAERFRRVEDLFSAAVDLPPDQREAWLDHECAGDAELRAEVQSLLDNDGGSATAFLEKRVRDAVSTMAESGPEPARRVGPYALLQPIGHGGMGSVWLAERVDDEYRSTVAIKLVRPGMDTDFILHRFRRERQILAQLTHPNIGRLLDGGTTSDGVPYIVMEYIDGAWITEYCDELRLGVRDRVQLFLQVCAAVDYAHRNLVVHRDLKPGNILVDQTGTPKLLDFGIGKLLYADPLSAGATMTQGIGMLTPEYASPEQVQGDAIGVTSDVYSLGAVLYELLTGARPHRFEKYTPKAVEEAICHQAVVRPSLRVASRKLARELDGDLDTIVLKAMQKEPARRYPSAAELAEDLRRYLEVQPIRARPDTAFYTARKFARRNRVWVFAGALVALSMLGGTVVALREARVANENALAMRALARTFIFDIHDAVRDLPGATRARQTIVETALSYLDGLAARSGTDVALMRELAAGYIRIGDVQGNSASGANLGDTEGARESYRKADALLERVAAENPRDRQALVDRAQVLRRLGDLEAAGTQGREALVTYERAAALARAALSLEAGDRHARTQLADVLMVSGRLRRQAGDMTGALDAAEEALRAFETLGADHPDDDALLLSLTSAESAVGLVLARLGRLEEAAVRYERAVDRALILHQREPDNVQYRRTLMLAYSHVGDIAGFPNMPNLNDPARAEQAYARMVAIARELHAADRDDVRSAIDLGQALLRLGAAVPEARFEDKAAALRQALDTLEEGVRRVPGDVDVRVSHGFVSVILGDLLDSRALRAEALSVYRRTAAVLEPALGATNPGVVGYYVRASRPLAEDLARRGDRAAALELTNQLVALAERDVATQKQTNIVGARVALPRAYAARMAVHAALRDRREAEEWRLKALRAWQELEGLPGFLEHFRQEMHALEREGS